jgi:uncharacterized protein YjiS (DUF1127 family)
MEKIMDGMSEFASTAGRQLPLWRRIAGLLALWRRRAYERRRLAQLDDRMLADIGVNRLDRARECRKPFWHA